MIHEVLIPSLLLQDTCNNNDAYRMSPTPPPPPPPLLPIICSINLSENQASSIQKDFHDQDAPNNYEGREGMDAM